MTVFTPSLRRRFAALTVLLVVWTAAPFATAADVPGRAAIASAHPLASAAGYEMLERGGNAFDAAVAVAAALSVVEPNACGPGGGGFWLLHRAADAFDVMIDGREVAPLAAHRDMYLDAHGKAIPGLSTRGPLAAGIPGYPAALEHLAQRYGKLPLAVSLAPAIRLAREGFPVYERLHGGLAFRQSGFNEAAARIMLVDGEVPRLGHVLKQSDLAATFQLIAAQGASAFYDGELAATLVEDVRAGGGIWTLEDLKRYRIIERAPLVADVAGTRITAPPPPSAGGVALINMLQILSAYDLDALDGVKRTHVVVEAMRRAFRDRAEYLGDPDFVDIPLERLTSADYAAGQRTSLRLDRATSSEAMPGILPASAGGTNTTHYSVLDAEGNRVSASMSLNFWFGAGYMVAGTGVLLNNEMDDFAVAPGVPNGYQLVGAEANAIAPGKRMLSSMTPVFIESPRGLAILGTPGGSRIISMTLLASLAWIEGADARTIVSLPRFHHQYHPDLISYEEDAIDVRERAALEAMGHRLQEVNRRYGNLQVVTWDRAADKVEAASDPRGEGIGRVY